MRLLQRYILAELLKIFSISLFVITLFMVMVFVFRIAQQQGLGIAQIVPLIPYILPEALRFAIPATILLAATSVYGRLSASNELIAIKAAGISPATVLAPTFIFTFLLSLVAVWMNDVAVTWGHDGVQRIVIEEVEDIVYSMLRTQRSYVNSRMSINVRRVEDRRLILPVFTFNGDENHPSSTITAQEAELKSELDQRVLKIVFRNCQIKYEGGVSSQFPDEFPFEIPLEEASRSGRSSSPSYIAMRDIPNEVATHNDRANALRQGCAVRTGFQMLTGEFDALTGAGARQIDDAIRSEVGEVSRLQVEPPRRWANGFSCLAFVLVGAPLSIRLRNSDLLSSFFACFLPILLIYYPLFLFGVDRAKRGELPSELVWLGNLLLACWGAWLLKRVFRY